MLSAEEELAMGEGPHIEEIPIIEETYETQGMEGEGEAKVEMQESKEEGEKPPKELTICPMCNGKGYCNKVRKSGVSHHKRHQADVTSCILPSLPKIPQHYHLEQLYRASEGKVLARLSDPAMVSNVSKPQTRLPPVHLPNSGGGKLLGSAGQIRSTPNSMSMGSHPLVNYLPPPKKFDKHPEDVARIAAIKLNRSECDIRKVGLDECLQLVHSYPEELEPHMSLVYRTMCSLLQLFRPNTTMYVCQAARELFKHMRSTCRPEYDEFVYALLGRTADTNKNIRLLANDALDKMVTYIPTVHAVRPLVEKGPIHNNPLVRTATARLLTCIVALKTPNTILTNPHLRETCKRIIETATLLLADSNIDTRAAAKKLISRFMNEDEFETVYYAEVDEKLRKRVHRVFLDIKSKVSSQS